MPLVAAMYVLPHLAAVHHAFERQWITAWEKDFYGDIVHKRNLTERQETKKQQINERVLRKVRRQR